MSVKKTLLIASVVTASFSCNVFAAAEITPGAANATLDLNIVYK